MTRGWGFFFSATGAITAGVAPFTEKLTPASWKAHEVWIVTGLIVASVVCNGVLLYGSIRALPRRRLLVALWENDLDKDPNVRVSVMIVKSRSFFNPKHHFLKRPKVWAEVAYRAPHDGKSGVIFVRGEGVVGLSWQALGQASKMDFPSFETDEGAYCAASKSRGLGEDKVRQLRTKARSIVCSPICEGADSAKIRGFVSVDSTEENAFDKDTRRTIDNFAKLLGHVLYGEVSS